MLIQEHQCIYKSYLNYLDWLDLSPKDYHRRYGCEGCTGIQNGERKHCFFTLDELVQFRENMLEVDQK